jgi:hypothetical protein
LIKEGENKMKPRKTIMTMAAILAMFLVFLAASPCAARAPDPTPTNLGMPEDCWYCAPNAINDLGQVVGEGVCGSPDNSDDPEPWVPIFWGNGQISTLPLPTECAAGKAVDINSSGQVVGSCWNWAWNDDWEDRGWYKTDWKACLWERESSGWSVTVLGAPEEKTQSRALAINDAGQILAETWAADYSRGSAVWNDGTWTELKDPDGGDLLPLEYQQRMNEFGEVLALSYKGDLILWSDGAATKIVTYFYPVPGLNNFGEIAGVYSGSDPHTAFIYQPLADLQTATVSTVGWLAAINDNGQTLFYKEKGYLMGTDLWFGDLNLTGETTHIDWVDNTIRSDEPPFLNASGDVSGNLAYPRRPFYANAAGVILLNGLVNEGPYVRVEARAMNASGVIVGTSSEADGIHPVMWGEVGPPANNPPVLSGVPASVDSVVGTPVVFTATATDPEGDALTFSLDGATDGAAIDPITGVFAWTPMGSGEFTFYVTVTDSHGALDTMQVTVDVGPAISVGKATASAKTKTVTLEVPLSNRSATAADGVTLTTVTLAGMPASSSLNIGTIAPGATILYRLSFKNVPSGNAQLALMGISSLGGFSSTQVVKVP